MPATCGTPFTKTSNGARTKAGRSTRVVGSMAGGSHKRDLRRCGSHTIRAGVRRRALVLVLGLRGRACTGGGRICRKRRARAGLPGVAQRRPDQRRLLRRLRLAAIAFLLVVGALSFSSPATAAGSAPRTDDGPQAESGGHTQLVWTLVPTVVLVALAAFVFAMLPGDHRRAGRERQRDADHRRGAPVLLALPLPERRRPVNEMVAPADTVVHLDVTAPENDVNHSWWVPRLGGKIDAIPGRINETWFKTSPGTYAARCAELCGIQHAVMTGTVRVVPRDQYVAFLDAREPAALGKQEFEGVCLTATGWTSR